MVAARRESSLGILLSSEHPRTVPESMSMRTPNERTLARRGRYRPNQSKRDVRISGAGPAQRFAHLQHQTYIDRHIQNSECG